MIYYRQPRLVDAPAFWPHPNFPSLSHALALHRIYAKDKHSSCIFCEAVLYAKFAKIYIKMNILGLDMHDNIKIRTANVRIVANFGSQILHLPRFLTPLAISRKLHASLLRGFLCMQDFHCPYILPLII